MTAPIRRASAALLLASLLGSTMASVAGTVSSATKTSSAFTSPIPSGKCKGPRTFFLQNYGNNDDITTDEQSGQYITVLDNVNNSLGVGNTKWGPTEFYFVNNTHFYNEHDSEGAFVATGRGTPDPKAFKGRRITTYAPPSSDQTYGYYYLHEPTEPTGRDDYYYSEVSQFLGKDASGDNIYNTVGYWYNTQCISTAYSGWGPLFDYVDDDVVLGQGCYAYAPNTTSPIYLFAEYNCS